MAKDFLWAEKGFRTTAYHLRLVAGAFRITEALFRTMEDVFRKLAMAFRPPEAPFRPYFCMFLVHSRFFPSNIVSAVTIYNDFTVIVV